MKLVGDQVVVRSATDADAPAIVAVMRCPGVRAWWWDFELDHPVDEISDPDICRDGHRARRRGRRVHPVRGGDQPPVPRRPASTCRCTTTTRARATAATRYAQFARYLIAERGHHRLTIDPALRNERAIRCYTSVGFKPVGVLRQYERGADGEWHDGLLMDLLASELQ